jgi:hypothetical protein
MRPSRAVIAALTLLLALPLIGAAKQESPRGPDHVVDCNTPASLNYALIERRSDSAYRIAGSGACESAVDLIQIRCWAVHRHTFSWHSHPSTTIEEAYFERSRVVVGWGVFAGSNNNRYKTHCDISATHGTRSNWSKESGSIVL